MEFAGIYDIHFEQSFLYSYIHMQWFSKKQKYKNKIQKTNEERKIQILKDLK